MVHAPSPFAAKLRPRLNSETSPAAFSPALNFSIPNLEDLRLEQSYHRRLSADSTEKINSCVGEEKSRARKPFWWSSILKLIFFVKNTECNSIVIIFSLYFSRPTIFLVVQCIEYLCDIIDGANLLCYHIDSD
ncbi:hypothetical protein OWV82_001488 [Melia azedarach]|uniref:Uncharacterized protein n=1 Tax=Melia azedarach TaxID=155640 RepID=A0ACC1YYN4_MELAZ|nr:hypothetical protein OWV82_001488 [Melia azedarach]